MKNFLIPKEKFFELLVLPIYLLILFIFFPQAEPLVLFAFGFIWNWAASNDLEKLFENKRYKLSMLKLVVNLQNLILKPFATAPEFIRMFLKVLPAGVFWTIVIYLNESEMPWWATFLGSLAFELLLLEINLIKRYRHKT